MILRVLVHILIEVVQKEGLCHNRVLNCDRRVRVFLELVLNQILDYAIALIKHVSRHKRLQRRHGGGVGGIFGVLIEYALSDVGHRSVSGLRDDGWCTNLGGID